MARDRTRCVIDAVADQPYRDHLPVDAEAARAELLRRGREEMGSKTAKNSLATSPAEAGLRATRVYEDGQPLAFGFPKHTPEIRCREEPRFQLRLIHRSHQR